MADFAAFQAVPAGSANGTQIGTPPPNCVGVQLYIPAGASVSYAAASSQPTSAPTAWTASAATGGNPAYVTEKLLPGQNLFITAGGAGVLFRWIMGG